MLLPYINNFLRVFHALSSLSLPFSSFDFFSSFIPRGFINQENIVKSLHHFVVTRTLFVSLSWSSASFHWQSLVLLMTHPRPLLQQLLQNPILQFALLQFLL